MTSPASDNPQSVIQNPQLRLTDSPWYWLLVFSLFAILAIGAIGIKYGKRQSGIERQYQARERVAEKLAAANKTPGDTRIVDQEARRPFAMPGNNLITLWPLVILLGLISMVAATMLFRASRAVPENEAPRQ